MSTAGRGPSDVVDQLAALRREVESCTRCRLHETRTQAVFGEGDPGSRLMFVGEAPGYHEDKQGRPFVGAAGKLLDELLASIGLTREQVYIANVLKSRPPGNRDPQPDEIAACRPYLERQIALIRPLVICSLGNFATKLLSGSQAGITKVHGVPQVREIAGHRFRLYPIFHPAAALYTPSMRQTLQADMFRLPQLLSEPSPDLDRGEQADGGPEGTPAGAATAGPDPQASPERAPGAPDPDRDGVPTVAASRSADMLADAVPDADPSPVDDGQLGLF